MTPTPSMIARTTKEWSRYAGEPVIVEIVGGSTMYAYGTELGVLRIYYKFRYSKDARAFYSKNMKSWVFSLAVRF